jgi:micrococcal nuclease
MKYAKKRYLIPVFIILLILIRFVADIGPERDISGRFRVTRIIDGDTMEFVGGDRLRLLAIDCPEKGQPLYDSARIILESITLGKIVNIEFGKRRRDGYGRILGYVRLDTLLLNEKLLRMGLAHIYLFDDNLSDRDMIDRLLTAQYEAMSDKVGIWALDYSQEAYYVVKKGSLRFHRPDCRSVKNLPWDEMIRFDSREDAFRAGYSPCRNCRP